MDLLEERTYKANEVAQIIHAVLEREGFKKEELLEELNIKEFFCVGCKKSVWGYFGDLPEDCKAICQNHDCVNLFCEPCARKLPEDNLNLKLRSMKHLVTDLNWIYLQARNQPFNTIEDFNRNLVVACSLKCQEILISQ